jgi:quercetin dioxygenase-like cupin family protein
MQKLNIIDLRTMNNPKPGQPFFILRGKGFGGVLSIMGPHTEGHAEHTHPHDCIIIGVSGEGIEIIEGNPIPVNTSDILYIPAGEKHMSANRSNSEFRSITLHITSDLPK